MRALRRLTTGDQRTDTFVILLLMASVLPTGLLWAIWAVGGYAVWPEFTDPFLVAASHLEDLIRWVWEAVCWLLTGPAAFISIAMGIAASLRRMPKTSAVAAMAAVGVLVHLSAVAERLESLSRWAFYTLWNAAETLSAIATVSQACLPAGVVILLLRRKRPLSGTSALDTPAMVTRLALGVNAATLLSAGGGLLTAIFWVCRALWPGPVRTSAPGLIRSSVDPLAGLAMLVCAVRLIRHSTMWMRWLRLAIIVELVRWGVILLIACVVVFIIVSTGLVTTHPVTASLALLAGSSITLPLTLSLLWYWFPRRHNVCIALRPEDPACIHCGYSLVGNVSGRCPECGQPVAAPDSQGQAGHEQDR